MQSERGSFPINIYGKRVTKATETTTKKARHRSESYGADDKISTSSRHFSTLKLRFRPRDPPCTSSETMVHKICNDARTTESALHIKS